MTLSINRRLFSNALIEWLTQGESISGKTESPWVLTNKPGQAQCMSHCVLLPRLQNLIFPFGAVVLFFPPYEAEGFFLVSFSFKRPISARL